jgi:protocatechuate 3,4-dioxygenase beta subunit
MENRASSPHWRSYLILVAAFALGCANPIAAEEPAALPPAGLLSVFGKVVNSSGDPQPGTRVLVRAASTPSFMGLIDYADVIAETTTDKDGRFVFERVSVPPDMDYVVEELGHRQRGADVIALAEGCGISWAPLYSLDNPEEITVTLEPAATLEGAVSGAEGALPDANITVLGISRLDAPVDAFLHGPGDLRLYASSLRPKATTDAQGRFRIDRLPAKCRVYLQVVHPEYQSQFLFAATNNELPSRVLSYPLGGEMREYKMEINPIEVKLARGLRVCVRVVDAEGDAPVRQGSIALWRQSREWKTSVAPDGTASLAVAEPGEYGVSYVPADRNDGLGIRQKATLTEAHASVPLQLVLRLPRQRWLEGRVVGKGTNMGLGGVTVSWSLQQGEENGVPSFFARTMTSADGRFRLSAVPGRGKLSLDGDVTGFFIPSYRTIPREEQEKCRVAVEVPENGDIKPLRIEVPRGLVVRGSVRDADGNAAPGAIIRAASGGRYGPRLRETPSDDRGHFEIAGLHPREAYEVSAVGRGAVAVDIVQGKESQPFDEAREVEVQLTMQPTVTLRGRVLLGGQPLPKVRLELSRGRRIDDGVAYRLSASATTGNDGGYELAGLRPGDLYHIEIQPPFPAVDPQWVHQSPYIQTLAADAKDEVVLPDVQLVRTTQTLAGIVVDPDGNPVAGATVSAQLNRGPSVIRSPTGPPSWMETGKDGRFCLTQLPDLPLELMAYIRPKGPDRNIRFPARVKCELNQQDIRIVLDPSLVEDE